MIPLDPLRRPLPCSLQDNVATIRLTQPSVAHRIESFDVVALSEVFDRIESDSIATRAMTLKRIRALSMKSARRDFPDDRSWFGNGSTGFSERNGRRQSDRAA